MIKNSQENLIQETQGSQETSNPKRQGLEVATSPGSDSLQGKLEVLDDAISHDVPITSANLTDLSSAVEEMKLSIGGKEWTLKDLESSTEFISDFLTDMNSGENVKKENLPTSKFEFINPQKINYKEKAGHSDESKFGQYTLDPETFGMDFENAKVFMPDLSAMTYKELYEVFKYVVDTYGDKYYIPGIEYWKWMIENPDKAEEAAKKQGYDIKGDDKYYYFPGSTYCDYGAGWGVPFTYWFDSKFHRDTRELGGGFLRGGRVLLLEREK